MKRTKKEEKQQQRINDVVFYFSIFTRIHDGGEVFHRQHFFHET